MGNREQIETLVSSSVSMSPKMKELLSQSSEHLDFNIQTRTAFETYSIRAAIMRDGQVTGAEAIAEIAAALATFEDERTRIASFGDSTHVLLVFCNLAADRLLGVALLENWPSRV